MEDISKIKVKVDGGFVGQFDIVVSRDSDMGLTEDKIYVVRKVNSYDTFVVENDNGELDTYSAEWFKKYEYALYRIN